MSMIGKIILFTRYFYSVGKYPNDIQSDDYIEGIVRDKVRLNKHPSSIPPQDYYVVSLGVEDKEDLTIVFVNPFDVKCIQQTPIEDLQS